MEVRKIMTKNPACATPDSTLQEVAHMMEMYDCGCIPVVEDHKTNKPVGTITDRDIAIRALGADKNPLEMKASDIMTTDIATVTPETTVEQCRDQMEDKQIRRILVVDKSGRCVGIVAQADVVQNETNPRQTAEFLRDISASSGSQHGGGAAASYQNQFGVSDRDLSGSRRDEMSSERESYRNFANQNRSYEQDFSHREDRHSQSSFQQGRKFKKSRKKEKSFFGGSNLMPFLIAVGAGAALKYFMAENKKSQTTFVPRSRVTGLPHTAQETTPKVSIELPTDAKIDIKERLDTTNRTTTATSTTSTASTLDTDFDTNPGIGRTAKL